MGESLAGWVDGRLNIQPQEEPVLGRGSASAEAEGLLFKMLLFLVTTDGDIQVLLVKVAGDGKSKGPPLNTFDDRVIIETHLNMLQQKLC